MRLDAVEEPRSPVMMMLQRVFWTGNTLRLVAGRLSGIHCVVLVTLGGHSRGGGDYLS